MSIYELVSTLVVVAAVIIVEFATVKLVSKYGIKVFKEY